MAESTFTLNSLANTTPAMTDWFIKADGNVNYTKCSLAQMEAAILADAFQVTDTDLSAYANAKFTVSRARMKKVGGFMVWFSIQATVAEAFDAPYGQNVITAGNDVIPAPAYTAELNGYNATKGNAVRAYKAAAGAGAGVSVVGSFSAGDIIVIGGCYII